jgi:hypothetical protein
MHPAGIAEVEWAKADGRWTTAYDRARTPRYAYGMRRLGAPVRLPPL